MNKFKKTFALFLLLLGIAACVQKPAIGHKYVRFHNKSDKTIDLQLIKRIGIPDDDTLLSCYFITPPVPPNTYIDFNANSGHGYGVWEKDFEWFSFIQFYVLDSGVFRQYYGTPCDTMRKYVPIKQRYKLTLKDLDSLGWNVVYPPSAHETANR